jgi:tetratricopeptide (TPR) repeat protein
MAINRDKVMEVAEKLVARGKIDGAIQEYRKLLADNPKDIALLNKVGDLYVRISRNDEAVRLFLQLAARYAEDGFFVKAIAIYKKILKFDPTRLLVYEKLADLYHKQGLANEARSQYQVLVDYHQKHGDLRAGANVLEKMAELDPDDPTPRVRLAEAYHSLGDRERELKEYRALAELMMRHGRFDDAGQVFARAVAAAPDDLAFITDAVLGLKDAGQPGAAARLLAVAVEKNPQAERIARLAGIGRGGAAAAAPPTRDVTSPGLRVRDVAPAPPELEERAAEIAREEAASEADFVVELPEEESAPSTEVRPTEEMLKRSPDSPWFDAGTAGGEAEFELEIEPIEEEAPPPAAAEAPPAEAPAPSGPIEWQFEAEPDLELELPETELELPSAELELPGIEAEAPAIEPVQEAAPEVAAEPEVELPAAPAAFEVGLDLEELERTAYEVVPEEVPIDRRLADLLAEAEVFRKYGLREKAHDRVREILQHDPQHLEALALQIGLLLDEGKVDKILPRAEHLESLVRGTPAEETIWPAIEQKLAKAGFTFDSGRPVSAPEPKKPKKDSVAALLEDLVGLTGETRKPKPAKRRPAETAPPAEAPPAPERASRRRRRPRLRPPRVRRTKRWPGSTRRRSALPRPWLRRRLLLLRPCPSRRAPTRSCSRTRRGSSTSPRSSRRSCPRRTCSAPAARWRATSRRSTRSSRASRRGSRRASRPRTSTPTSTSGSPTARWG